jgi:hypothetical protein
MVLVSVGCAHGLVESSWRAFPSKFQPDPRIKTPREFEYIILKLSVVY